MKVFYSLYSLTPKKAANRLSSLEVKSGVFLKAILGDKILFADYFPHLALGDRAIDEFLADFKYQKEVYDRKVFDLLLKDAHFQSFNPKPFLNHQLWSTGETLDSPVIKYKLREHEDLSFLTATQKNIKVRLDANGLFTRETIGAFLKAIPQSSLSLIEYLEDPLSENDWTDLSIACASDFIQGTPSQFTIYKPNCEFLPKTSNKIIYSSYLGSDLGRWHAACELMGQGDLNLFHGIHTPGFYFEQRDFLEGHYKTEFTANMNQVHHLYKKVAGSDWKLLCSM